MKLSVRNATLVLPVAGLALSLGGCASYGTMSNKQKGAIVGATGGAVLGGAVGTRNGGVAKGAIIGAVVGGAAGAIIGHQMDQQAKELKQNIPGAVVERVGEGIKVTFESGLLYDFDSDVVKPTARANLTNLAASLDRYEGSNLLIVGHTDAQGSDSYNQRLSERRARSAADFLVARGVSASRVRTRGMGESEPVASNGSESGRAENRRVEVAIYASESMQQQARRQAGSE